MSVFNRKPLPTLGTQLNKKSVELYTKAAEAHDSAQIYLDAHKQALTTAATANKHATAVDAAVAILTAAGVDL